MLCVSWWQRLFNKIPLSPARRNRSGASTRRMEVEVLEDRTVPSTIFVNSTADADNGLALGNGPTTLRKAVRIANLTAASDTIQLANATYNFSNHLGEMVLFTNMTIKNASGGTHFSTIDANSESRIFDTSDSTVLLDHLILREGKAPANSSTAAKGGAIIQHGGSLTLNYDQFLGNNATGFSGGEGNPTGAFGGAIYVDSVVELDSELKTEIAPPVGTLTVKNSTFDGNTATGGSDLVFSFDGADAEGGAVFIKSGVGSITASTFSNNHAIGGDSNNNFGGDAFGGALVDGSFEGDKFSIVNSTFTSNTAHGGTGFYGEGYYNGEYDGHGVGGAIVVHDGPTVNLINDTIANNSVVGTPEGERGGGVASDGVNIIRVVNTIIAGNHSFPSAGLTSATPSAIADDVSGEFDSLGHNLIGDVDGSSGFTAAGDLTGSESGSGILDPGLVSFLSANGANSAVPKTLALFATSRAINAADNGVTTGILSDGTHMTSLGVPLLTTDERGPGFARKFFNRVDIGAYEFQLNLSRFFQFRSSNAGSITFTVPRSNYLGLLAGIGNFGLLPGQHFEIVPFVTNFGPGTSLTVNKDGSFSFTVPKRYANIVSFQFKLRVVSMPHGSDPEFPPEILPTTLAFTAVIQVIPPRGGRGSAGSYLP